MKIIVGLGNPSRTYAGTRHNVGFWVIDMIAESLAASFKEKDHALQAVVHYEGEKMILLKPQTFMNLSGFAVALACNFYKIEIQDLLIIYDDMDLAPGRIRLRRGGSGGGHNGMKSVIEQLGQDKINRLRIGIGRSPYGDNIDYVLTPFSQEQLPLMADAVEKAAAASLLWAKAGITEAMNQYNKKEQEENKEENKNKEE
jgi:PTH1 family peptidyl-tRNA hydrolase